MMNSNSDKHTAKRRTAPASASIPASILHFRFPISCFRGISLMEVLASTFVIGVGLLGVLAVIPFGAFQVSKARDAEHCSNMLDAAAKELIACDFTKMSTWRRYDNSNALQSTNMYRLDGSGNNESISGTPYYLNHSTQSNRKYNTKQYLLVDPFFESGSYSTTPNINAVLSHHLLVVGAGNSGSGGFDNLSVWQERMRGQDDLLFTLSDKGRTTLVGNRPISSGKYTWFFMFRPTYNGGTSGRGWADEGDVSGTADVDLLACYGKSIDSIRTVYSRFISPTANNDDYSPLQKGAMITFRSTNPKDLDFSKSKYVFVSWVASWDGTTMNYVDGVWCKIVNSSEIAQENSNVIVPEGNTVAASYKCTVMLIGSLPHDYPRPSGVNSVALRGAVIDGVLYHKRLTDVPVK